MYIHICVYIYIYTYIHIYIYIYIYRERERDRTVFSSRALRSACAVCRTTNATNSILFTLLDLCVSSLHRGHANLLCIVPILTDDPRRESVQPTAYVCTYAYIYIYIHMYVYIHIYIHRALSLSLSIYISLYLSLYT